MNSKNKMEVMPMGKLIFNMSLPMMLSLLIQSLYNIVDSMFVSRLSEDALTATSLAYPVQMVMIAVGVGSAVGLNAILSKALGAGQTERVSLIAANGIFLATASSLIFCLAGLLFSGSMAHAFTDNADIAGQCRDYLWICMVFSLGNMVTMTLQRMMQATGRTFLSMLILILGAVTNIVMDPVLIFGLLGAPALGIKGAAIATVIGQWASMIFGLILQAKFNPEVKLSLHSFRIDANVIKDIYHVGLPTIITQAMQSMMLTCFNMILVSFSTSAVAFFGIYYKLQSFLFMPMNGLGQAAIPIIGFNYGAGNTPRIREAVRKIIPTAVAIAALGTVLFSLLPKQLLALFAAGGRMLSLGIPAIRIMAPTFILAAFTMVAGYIASGLQDGWTNMLGALIRQFIPLIPCAWIFCTVLGTDKVWYAFWVSEICGAVFCYFRLRSLMNKLPESNKAYPKS